MRISDWSSDVCSSDLDGRLKDVKAVMPESTFARIYQEMISFCKTHGAFDPKTMGTVPNVGLMAQQAEEYGSHDKTFEITEDGIANITDLDTGEVLLTQNVERSEEHTSELQSLMRISYAVFCLKKKKKKN